MSLEHRVRSERADCNKVCDGTRKETSEGVSVG